MQQYFLPVRKFREKPYANILGFPKATKRQIESRLIELEKLGITSVSFNGPIEVDGVRIIGKGYVGVVILVKKKSKIFALKIRRTDSPRKTMKGEALLLQIANRTNVGPRLIQYSKNFLVMEFIDGMKIVDWVNELNTKNSKKLRIIIKKILLDCFTLDQIGLDHGELSVLDKHVLITDKKPTIIDFESSSMNRKISNVSSATQAILIGTGLARIIRKKTKIPRRDKIIKLVRNYKKSKTQESFDQLLFGLKL
ncbi:MAG: RIO1 family regulatory kinase/ATPase [Candidatus Nitrosopelagicus sp.]|jgi:putative serine/threonine protein kinase|nr:RIO1 family regulatory kinase/ATPase [Candidatus Nitrosopelagicus sp.]